VADRFEFCLGFVGQGLPSYGFLYNWADLDCFCTRLLAGDLFCKQLCYCRRLSRASTLVQEHTNLGIENFGKI